VYKIIVIIEEMTIMVNLRVKLLISTLVLLAWLSASCTSQTLDKGIPPATVFEAPPPPETPYSTPSATPPIIVAIQLPAPILVSPLDKAIMDNARENDFTDRIVWDFDWSDVPGATQYQLSIRGPDYPIRGPFEPQMDISSYQFLSEWGGYYLEKYRYGWTWKVRAMDSHNWWGKWSEERNFDLEAPTMGLLVPPAPTLISPAKRAPDNAIQQWASVYNAPTNDWPVAMAVDDLGNVYVLGESREPPFSFVTIKYDASGQQIWATRSSFSGEASALVLDDGGNVYVTGESWVGIVGNLMDFVTVKYDADGQERWVNHYRTPGYKFSGASAIALDGSGGVLVCGRSYASDNQVTGSAIIILKYDNKGKLQKEIAYPTGEDVGGTAMRLDRKGNIYVVGDSGSIDNHTSQYLTVKFDPSGNMVWAERYKGPQNANVPIGLELDSQGNVYVSGSSASKPASFGFDFATVKYDVNGNEQWVRRYDRLVRGGEDQAKAMGIDNAGNIYVTGSSGALSDYATVKYDTNGQELWVALYNGPANDNDFPSNLVLDKAGNVYIAGSSVKEKGLNYDINIIKYDTNGQKIWDTWYSGPGASWDIPNALKLDAAGNIYVTGQINAGEIVTIKYTQSKP
jgi:hypothetical protein